MHWIVQHMPYNGQHLVHWIGYKVFVVVAAAIAVEANFRNKHVHCARQRRRWAHEQQVPIASIATHYNNNNKKKVNELWTSERVHNHISSNVVAFVDDGDDGTGFCCANDINNFALHLFIQLLDCVCWISATKNEYCWHFAASTYTVDISYITRIAH